TPDQLLHDTLWMHRSGWATQSTLPHHKVEDEIGAAEVQRASVVQVFLVNQLDWIVRFSSLTRLTRVTAWMFRFIHRCRTKMKHDTEFLSAIEIQTSLTWILRTVQNQEFRGEIREIERAAQVPRQNHIASLSPFLDHSRILRVGGRLDNAKLPYDVRHPILLPTHHHITDLIVMSEHRRLLH